jgi:hypothetical protein
MAALIITTKYEGGTVGRAKRKGEKKIEKKLHVYKSKLEYQHH